MMFLMEMKRVKLALAFYHEVKKLKENVRVPLLAGAQRRERERDRDRDRGREVSPWASEPQLFLL